MVKILLGLLGVLSLTACARPLPSETPAGLLAASTEADVARLQAELQEAKKALAAERESRPTQTWVTTSVIQDKEVAPDAAAIDAAFARVVQTVSRPARDPRERVLRPGEQTRADVLRLFGRPYEIWKGGETVTWIYGNGNEPNFFCSTSQEYCTVTFKGDTLASVESINPKYLDLLE